MVRFLPHAVGEAQRLEDLERAALQAVGLTCEDLGVALVDYARFDASVRGPGGGHHAGGMLVAGGGMEGRERGEEGGIPCWAGADD